MLSFARWHRHGFRVDSMVWPEDVCSTQLSTWGGNAMTLPAVGACIMAALCHYDLGAPHMRPLLYSRRIDGIVKQTNAIGPFSTMFIFLQHMMHIMFSPP